MVKVYNTLSRKKEVFKPQKGTQVNLFVCGPTVYDFSHIGHARTYIAFDIIVKYLASLGLKVFYLQNITDIDDKIINRARELGITPQELARRFEKEYFKDMKALGITSVRKYARATDHIKEIVSQVKRLLGKGYAYEIEDGIYYDISKFKDYGKLSGRTTLQAEDAVSRIDESVHKRNKGDFALWKISKPEEPKWESPWGSGRPGWHIEDTAITEKYFGAQYDIHGGARDLIFPHHEAEIAQMRAISGKKFLSRYWLHTGFLTVEGEKMSKSLGNFITIRDFLKTYSPRLLRLLVVKTHYRSPIDYSEKIIQQTESELERLDEFVDRLREKLHIKRPKSKSNAKFQIRKFQKDFKEAMDDDFNTPKAIAVIFELIGKVNPLFERGTISREDAKTILSFLQEVDTIFGCIFWGRVSKINIPEEIQRLVRMREEYRKRQEWGKADELREELQRKGWLIEDTSAGPRIKYLK